MVNLVVKNQTKTAGGFNYRENAASKDCGKQVLFLTEIYHLNLSVVSHVSIEVTDVGTRNSLLGFLIHCSGLSHQNKTHKASVYL